MKKLLLSLALLASWSVTAEVMIYGLNITNTITDDGAIFKQRYGGRFVFAPDGSQAAQFLIWATVNGRKYYGVSCPRVDSRIAPAPKRKDHTALFLRWNDPDDIAIGYLRGTNTFLALSPSSDIDAPKVFRGFVREGGRDDDGEERLHEASIIATFQAAATLTANVREQTVTDAILEQVNLLEAQGYVNDTDVDEQECFPF